MLIGLTDYTGVNMQYLIAINHHGQSIVNCNTTGGDKDHKVTFLCLFDLIPFFSTTQNNQRCHCPRRYRYVSSLNEPVSCRLVWTKKRVNECLWFLFVCLMWYSLHSHLSTQSHVIKYSRHMVWRMGLNE